MHVENIFCLCLSWGFGNMIGGLREQEMMWEQELQACVSTAFLGLFFKCFYNLKQREMFKLLLEKNPEKMKLRERQSPYISLNTT